LPSNPAAGTLITFTDNSTCYTAGGCTSASIFYLWDFGNGLTSSLRGNSTTTYSSAGYDTVSLTITDTAAGMPAGASCTYAETINVRVSLPKWQEIPPVMWVRKLLADIRESLGNSFLVVLKGY
jgi:PKD repeat protein